MHQRNILIIVHDFPPHSGGAVMRILKFVKYLPEFGWRPIILTVRPEYYRFIDQSLLAEIPDDAWVIRTSSFQSKAKSQKRVLSAYYQSPKLARKLLKGMRAWMFRTFFVFQDERFLWLPYALVMSRRLVQQQDVKAIFSTSPPHAVQWLGLALKKEFKVPWIVDFRDGWVDNPLFSSGFPVRRWLESRVERAAVRTADHVIAATPPIADHLATRYPDMEQSISVIMNGFDPQDFVYPKQAHSLDSQFTIVYSGSLAGQRRPVEPLFEALERLIKEVPRSEEDIKLKFVGSFGPNEQELVAKHGLTSTVESTGWLEHKEAIQHMLQAEVLLVISSELDGGKEVMTGKVFEYIAAERFIFVLAPSNSAVSKLVTEAGLGIAVPPTDVDAVYRALKELYLRFLSGNLKPKIDPIFKSQFNRLEQTRKLADLFEQVSRSTMVERL